MKTSEHLEIGRIYTRQELREMFTITDATLNTGVFRPKGYESIWLFVTLHKTPDRTQYSDILDEDILYWDGQTSGRTDPLIINHQDQGLELLVFYRNQKYEYPNAAFQYKGPFEYISFTGKNPAHFVLKQVFSLESMVALDLEAISAEEHFEEGGKKLRFTNYYERDPNLRVAAIAHHGTKCMACGFDFKSYYGEYGRGYIEVHHLMPVSRLKQKTKVNPKTDMAVVCSNCHRMIHRRKDKVLSIESLRQLIKKSRN